jgi:hypothetical protein
MWCSCEQCRDIEPSIATLINETYDENIGSIFDENFEYSLFNNEDDSENDTESISSSELFDDIKKRHEEIQLSTEEEDNKIEKQKEVDDFNFMKCDEEILYSTDEEF